MSELIGEGLFFGGDAAILGGVDVRLKAGELVAVLGPNGAGKTSLIRALLGLVKTDAGRVTIDGEPLTELKPDARARQIAYLPQSRPLAWSAPVTDVVALGRFAYGGAPANLGKDDASAVQQAMVDCSIDHLADRAADTLSGGEAARMHLARALSGRTPLLIADEPVAALDPLHQHKVMALFRQYVDAGGGAMTVLHDIGLAARFADRLVWMKQGRIVADGSPHETLTPERMETVFGVKAKVEACEIGLNVRILGPC